MEYRDLVRHLQPHQAVDGCELPDRPQGEQVLNTLEELAGDRVREVREKQPTGPYFLCGYCWGGVLAFEMARQLRAAGGEVALLRHCEKQTCAAQEPDIQVS